ncbi:6243_t:CDS:2 [Paraglomus brasilianum]|uniref:6243_t:CDS:1 n=1 Tax=Paraglomus brasilianum TaxID=144538 RepID=A0A9N9G1S8_9GLOM|nr:6243_t:CDS:2 [Paraglomus brasilianum]
MSSEASASATTPPVQDQSASTTFLSQSRIRQNDNYVTVSIFIKNTKKDATSINFGKQSLSVSVKLPAGSEYSLELDPLAHEIVPNGSRYELLSTKIEIKLRKASVGLKWGVLEGEDKLAVSMGSSGGQLSYPSSARKAKNWDALEKEISEDKDAPEGDAALNALFQQLYRDADDDSRRAMMKSYVESSGTCLSTNWDEVRKDKVETKPPDGMVAKKVECILE